MTPSRSLPLVFISGTLLVAGCAKQRDYSTIAPLAVDGRQSGDSGVSDAGANAADAHLPTVPARGAAQDGGGSVKEPSGEFGLPAPGAAPGASVSWDAGQLGTPAAGPAVCKEDLDCEDENPCNGQERCETATCLVGSSLVDGSECSGPGDAPHVCRSGNCLSSRCGDGIVDAREHEECDDGNPDNHDGCNRDCTFSCSSDEDCNDSNICNGEERCDPSDHVCIAGETLADETSCGDGFDCRTGRCVSAACGDGSLGEGEECDDGNAADGDGCDANCRYECWEDADCNDGNACNGAETCDAASHVCESGVTLDCEDGDPCTNDTCDPKRGCTWSVIDEDDDGQSPQSLGECGTDCDDTNPAVYLGAAELCDQVDNDCNGRTDEIGPTWYSDCDGDGFAPAEATGVQQCEAPSVAAPACAVGLAGRWTSRAPTDAPDCWDADPTVHPGAEAPWSIDAIPGQSELAYDYNCDGQEEPRYTNTGMKGDACLLLGTLLQGSTRGREEIAPLLCGGAEGWEGKRVPSCGETGTYIYCNGCDRVVVEEHAQQCR